MKAKRQNIFLNRKGQSLVEFVFVLTLFLLVFCMLMGLIQIAYNWVVLQYAASEGSRFGSLGIVEAGFANREENIEARVLQITQSLGLEGVQVQFVDQTGAATAGGASEYFRMRLSRDIQLEGMLRFFLDAAGFAEGVTPQYAITAWTVIRNEPF